MNLKEELQAILHGEVIDDPQHLDSLSRDASLFELLPRIAVAPKDTADLCRLVEFVAAHPGEKLTLTPRSAGTDMSGGPLTTSIVVEMTPHFNQVLEVGDGFSVTQPGVYYRDFEKATLKKNLLLPCYTASRELNTVGGMVANNSAGEKTLKYGKMEDFIEELEVVFADGKAYTVKPLNKKQLDAKMAQGDYEGNIYKGVYELIEANYDLIKGAKPNVTKNSAGYYLWNVWDRETGIFDLNKLLVGSQGTLGIVTKSKIRLIHPPKHSRMVVIFLNDLTRLGTLVNDVLAFKPESFESYDDHTLKLAIRFMPEMAKRMNGKNLIAMGISFLPEALTVIRMGGLPKLVLMAEFTGDKAKEVEDQTKACYDAIRHYGYQMLTTVSEDQGKKYWTVRRESFSLLRKHIKEKHTAPVIDDTVVHPSDLPTFLPELDKVMGRYDLTYTVAGHIGDANFHIIPLMNLADPETQKIIPKLSREVYDLVIRYHGSITGEHNDGMIRTPYLLDMYGQKVYNLFVKTKKIFDPKDILNPGKKVHGNLPYAMRHFVNDAHIHGDAKRWVAPK